MKGNPLLSFRPPYPSTPHSPSPSPQKLQVRAIRCLFCDRVCRVTHRPQLGRLHSTQQSRHFGFCIPSGGHPPGGILCLSLGACVPRCWVGGGRGRSRRVKTRCTSCLSQVLPLMSRAGWHSGTSPLNHNSERPLPSHGHTRFHELQPSCCCL